MPAGDGLSLEAVESLVSTALQEGDSLEEVQAFLRANATSVDEDLGESVRAVDDSSFLRDAGVSPDLGVLVARWETPRHVIVGYFLFDDSRLVRYLFKEGFVAP